MRFDTKIAVVVLGELPTWQKLNVVAFSASGVAVSVPDVTGAPYEDASGNTYLPMFRQPVLVFEADAGQIRAAFDRAMAPELARPLLQRFVRELQDQGCPVETGFFQEAMVVDLENDGPATFILER